MLLANTSARVPESGKKYEFITYKMCLWCCTGGKNTIKTFTQIELVASIYKLNYDLSTKKCFPKDIEMVSLRPVQPFLDWAHLQLIFLVLKPFFWLRDSGIIKRVLVPLCWNCSKPSFSSPPPFLTAYFIEHGKPKDSLSILLSWQSVLLTQKMGKAAIGNLIQVHHTLFNVVLQQEAHVYFFIEGQICIYSDWLFLGKEGITRQWAYLKNVYVGIDNTIVMCPCWKTWFV